MKNRKLHEILEAVETRDDFVKFVMSVLEDYIYNSASWKNPGIVDFLEAIAAWTEDMDGFYANQNKAMPTDITWKIFAEIIYAARLYE